MSRSLTFTLVSDGSSDAALQSVLLWLLEQQSATVRQALWADLRWSGGPKSLHDRIEQALRLYPCDLLFVHRDAEKVAFEVRRKEILDALEQCQLELVPAVCVVPVRMQEAWLLCDEAALRAAAGNPHGKETLDLPPVVQLESLPDPKRLLHDLLRQASGLGAKRRKRLPVQERTHRLADLIEDFSALRALPAFARLERDLVSVLADLDT